VRHRLTGGQRSDVFDCVTAEGKEAVLKLTARPGEAETEAAALRAWQQSGAAVRLLDADAELGALLRPGTPLTDAGQEAAIDVAAELLAQLHTADRAGFRFPALQDSYVDYEQRTRADAEVGAAGVARLPEARAAALRLCATAGRVVLLHGDFLDKNLLWSGSRIVAIDPNPAIGDPCADAGFFAACRQPATGIWERADAVARRIGEDPARRCGGLRSGLWERRPRRGAQTRTNSRR
jgi:streptomycin 6-kinase